MKQQEKNACVSEGELFRKILGTEWQKLHPDIRTRFVKNPALGKLLQYSGTLRELTCSRIGKLLGFITMPMIKGALIPYSDTHFRSTSRCIPNRAVPRFSSSASTI
ncbi:MAG TPA: hypothetical protein VN114_00215 [Oxalicibacterium sp.]|uniref:hypothetical protein n=1 Tax=Oxalicibacterium sp. TaxID=2766525 RepID=UPI002C8CFBD7|nr:hypothetical protein [Oxalicibacterium sp.]HWU96911.1 hypothetical protein [Oxalicibacterium sp.]